MMADRDEQTYEQWLKANPVPSFAALIHAMAATRQSRRGRRRRVRLPLGFDFGLRPPEDRTPTHGYEFDPRGGYAGQELA